MRMSKTVWKLVIWIGLPVAAAIYLGVSMGNSFGGWFVSRRIVSHPPREYAELFKGRDSSCLQFLETILDRNRNPISCYRFRDKYEILETRLNFSDTGRLRDKLNIVQAEIPERGLTDSYDEVTTGAMHVDFQDLQRPDSAFRKVTLSIEGRRFDNSPGNDSVVSYFLEKGYFSISRSPGGVPDIFSSQGERRGLSGSTIPTALLFKSRGKFVFVLVGSPVHGKTDVPQDLLLRLVNDKN
jgi:hypothetical protein